MTLGLFSRCSDEFAHLDEPLREGLSPLPGFELKTPEQVEGYAGGSGTLAELWLYIQKARVVIHLVGGHLGHTPRGPRVAEFLAQEPAIAAWIESLQLDCRAWTYTQWEAWLGLYRRAQQPGSMDIFVCTPEGSVAADGASDVTPAASAHLAALRSVGSHPEIHFQDAHSLLVKLLTSDAGALFHGSASGPDSPLMYDAFISYAHEQQDVAIWLHRLLERYWVPGRRARTVFLDREHLTADELGPMIEGALVRSRALIVLCSGAARESKWVDREVDHFVSRHGTSKVFGARVGSPEDRALPRAIERNGALTGKLIPPLYGPVAAWDRSTRSERTLAAQALLGSILGLDKSQITARRQRATWFYSAAAVLVLAGSIGAVTAWDWWRRSTWIAFDRSALFGMAKDWRYELIRWDIDRNAKSTIRSGLLPNGTLRLDVPPGSYTLSLSGAYADSLPRTLMWPLVFEGVHARTLQLRLPAPASIERAAHMAWISAGHEPIALGRDGELQDPPQPFWIDVYPVRASEVWGTDADSKLRDVNSVENALAQVPAGNLPELVDDMKGIMAHLDAETENLRRIDPEQFPSVMLRATKTPCDQCPAPVSKDDAVAWCAQRGGRLPTPEEWQLAARGLDNRLYPWGNRFERGYANIVGLPNKGDTLALTPVDQFPHSVSPYGVWDTVGNSGEWVDDGDLTSNMQAGGGYWNDRDGATVYALDPVSDAWPYEIGVRCVIDELAR